MKISNGVKKMPPENSLYENQQGANLFMISQIKINMEHIPKESHGAWKSNQSETCAKLRFLALGGSRNQRGQQNDTLGIKCKFVSIDTDAQALHKNQADRKVHIGKNATKGLGSGMNPETWAASSRRKRGEELVEVIENGDMAFITCGLGGGTGSGASADVAELAKNKGILTVGVVTKLFTFEGSKKKVAETAYDNLKEKLTLLIISDSQRSHSLQNHRQKTSLVDV